MTSRLSSGRIGVLLAALLGTSAVAHAQSPADGFDPGANNNLRAVVVQPDGKILVGGDFTQIGGGGTGSTSRAFLARLNPDGSVDAFDPVADNSVRALAYQPNGQVVVAGDFLNLGSGPPSPRARIGRVNADGTLDTFDPGANGPINTVVLQADGRILVGGSFTMLGGGGSGTTTRNNIGRLNIDGTLDTTFNPGADGEVFLLAVQPNGKILVGGAFTGLGGITGTTTRNRIGRLNADGTVDAFDPNANGDVEAIGVQPDGRVVLGGHFTALAGGAPNSRKFIGRVHADGSLDTGFNPGADDTVETLALQPDGKIVVSGNFTMLGGGTGTTPRNRLGRINPGGSVDAFNPGADSVAHAITVQPDGKIVVGGSFTLLGGGGSGSTTRNHVGRLHADGSLEVDFDPGADGFVSALALQPDGKILVGGDFLALGGGTGTMTHEYIGRLNADGSVDGTFTPSANCEVLDIAVQPDGKIVLGGFFTEFICGAATITRNSIARLNADGTLDEDFNPGANNGVQTVAIQPDGKILVGGFFSTIGGGGEGNTTRNTIARLNPDGTVDTAFDPGTDGGVYTIVVQPDGKILVGGTFGTLAGITRANIGRLNPDGTIDEGFDPGADNTVFTMTLQSDGKILVGGHFDGLGGGTGTTPRSRIGRLNVDGSVDTFDPGADQLVQTIAVQSNGKIVVGGFFSTLGGGGTGSDIRNAIGRVDADGNIDPDFDPGAGGGVSALAVQPDGKIVAGGDFTSLGDGGATTRNFIGRLTNPEAASQSLTVTSGGTVATWLRSGAGPEVDRATFESSADGVTYSLLGSGTRVAGGWQLTGQSLATNQNLHIRARGYYNSGVQNGSGSIAESILNTYVSCPAISPASLVAGTAGVPYSTTFTAPTAIGLVSFGQTGTLPTGMGFSVDTISGTPTQTGSFPITVTATDASSGCLTSQNLTLTINCPTITLSMTAFPGGTQHVAYPATTVTQTGGIGMATFAITGGALPAGLLLSSAGTVSGTPTESGLFNFTVTATDGNGCTGSRPYSLTLAADAPPVISIIGTTTTPRNTPVTVSFTVSDAETGAASVTLSGTSSVQTLVPNANLVFGGSGTNRTLTITPIDSQVGSTTITVFANDGFSSSNTSFLLEVPSNSAPTISGLINSVTAKNTQAAVSFTVGDVDTGPSTVVLSGASSNPTLVPNANLSFSGSGASRTLQITPALDQYGATTITVMASDGSLASSATFVLVVYVGVRGDLNGDGKADLFWRHAVDGQDIGFLMNGTVVANSAFLPTVGDTNWEIPGLGDLNAEGRTDAIWRHRVNGQNVAWLMNGLTVMTSAFLPTIADTNWEIKGMGDVNGDAKADVVFRNRATGQNIVWLMDGLSIAVSAFLPTVVDTNWEIRGLGDLDAGGKADVLWRHRTTGQNLVWLMNGVTVASVVFLPTVADTNWQFVGIGDLDGDAKADVLLRHATSGQNIAWLMNGTTVAASAFLGTLADTNWEVRSVGDLDADGRADIVWRHRASGQNVAWLMDGLTMRSAVFLPTVADVNWRIVGQ